MGGGVRRSEERKNKSGSDRQQRRKQLKTFAGCSVNRSAPGRSQAEGDERNSPGASMGKAAQLALTSPSAEEK